LKLINGPLEMVVVLEVEVPLTVSSPLCFAPRSFKLRAEFG
jgi:hypothetical protein